MLPSAMNIDEGQMEMSDAIMMKWSRNDHCDVFKLKYKQNDFAFNCLK